MTGIRRSAYFVLLFALAAAPACGPRSQFQKAQKLENKEDYYNAWKAYQQFAAEHPDHALAPEALFRAGWVVQRHVKDCFMAGVFYDSVAERYPDADPWARAAFHQKRNCPDYYPLLPGSNWVEGDSETDGKNARIEITCEPIKKAPGSLPSESGVLKRVFYGGEKKSHETTFVYKKSDEGLFEFASEEDPSGKRLLAWPLTAGTKWTTKSGGRLFHYEITDVDRTVKVSAGEFKDCLRVSSFVEGYAQASTIEYYAPNIGRILTSVAVKGVEKRNTELLLFQIADWPKAPGEKTNP